jgi:hypothetical protein
LTRAGSPVSKEQSKIPAIDGAGAVEVRCSAGPTPRSEQDPQVGAVDHPIAVEVGPAVLRWKQLRPDSSIGHEGWAVSLPSGQIDSAGRRGEYMLYPFRPGTSFVSQSPAAGWAQTLPTSSGHTIFVGAFKHARDVHFGSHSGCGELTIDSLNSQGSTTTVDLTVCNESCMEICEIRVVPSSGSLVASRSIATNFLGTGGCEQFTVTLQTGLEYSIELGPCAVDALLGPCTLATTLLHSCEWDLNGDGVVDGADLALLLGGGFGSVSGQDIAALMAAFGSC